MRKKKDEIKIKNDLFLNKFCELKSNKRRFTLLTEIWFYGCINYGFLASDKKKTSVLKMLNK